MANLSSPPCTPYLCKHVIGINTDIMNIPLFFFIMCVQCEQLPMFVFISFHSAVCLILRFSALSRSNIVFSENRAQELQGHIWLNADGAAYSVSAALWEIRNTWKLILHQVSSIFAGSGSLGKCSRDTRKMVCTSRPRGGLYGRRHLRSPPASHLKTKPRDKDLNSCTTAHYLAVFTFGFTLWCPSSLHHRNQTPEGPFL